MNASSFSPTKNKNNDLKKCEIVLLSAWKDGGAAVKAPGWGRGE
jgi:hypothetical protein